MDENGSIFGGGGSAKNIGGFNFFETPDVADVNEVEEFTVKEYQVGTDIGEINEIDNAPQYEKFNTSADFTADWGDSAFQEFLDNPLFNQSDMYGGFIFNGEGIGTHSILGNA